MTTAHRDLLARIAADIRVDSPRRFVHATTGTHRVVPPRPGADPDAAAIAAVATLIYTHYYLATAAAGALGRRPDIALISDAEDPAFGRLLRDANTGHGYRSPGWIVVAVDGPDPTPVSVQKGRLTLRARLDQIDAAVPGAIAPGVAVTVRFPKDRAYAMRGFYAAVGDAGTPAGDEPMTRWYVHLRPDAAPELMRGLTTSLNRFAVPFALKMLNDPAAYTRPDAAVLYLPRHAFVATAPAVLAAYRPVAAGVRPRVPAFTRQVAPGLALADEPPAAARPVSFGQHRARLIASGLVEATGRESTHTQRFDRIAAAFAAAGISLDAPHLNPGAPEYSFDNPAVDRPEARP